MLNTAENAGRRMCCHSNLKTDESQSGGNGLKARGRRGDQRPAQRPQGDKTKDGAFGGPSSYLGDLAIAPVVARRNARRFRRTFENEMRVLILHGMLHLLGYDHETDEGQMERYEMRLRRRLKLA